MTTTAGSLGAYVRAARLAAGMTQAGLGEAAGFSRTTVSMVEADIWRASRVSDAVLDGLRAALPTLDREEVYARAGKLVPELRTMTPDEMRACRTLLDGRAGAHPLDPNGGAPLAHEE